MIGYRYMEKIILLAFLSIAILSIPFLIHSEIERQDWLKNHCAIIDKMSSSVGTANTINYNGSIGIGTTVIPSKTGYKCDDGNEYWE